MRKYRKSIVMEVQCLKLLSAKRFPHRGLDLVESN